MKTVHGENPREMFLSGLAIPDPDRQDMAMLTRPQGLVLNQSDKGMEKRQKQDMDAMGSGALDSLTEKYSTLYLQSVYYRLEERVRVIGCSWRRWVYYVEKTWRQGYYTQLNQGHRLS